MSWTQEDAAVWDSLVQAGFIDPAAPPSLLTLVTGACRYERARILNYLHNLPTEQQLAVLPIITWIMIGDSDRDPR